MKIVLVDNFFFSRDGAAVIVEVNPHLGLMSLATILIDAGHDVEIVDPKIVFRRRRFRAVDGEFFDSWAEECLSRSADLVGFTAYGRTTLYAIKVAQRLKHRRPGLPVIIGGPHATIVGRQLLQAFDCFDVAVRFEAENTIVETVEAIHRGDELGTIPNLVFRQADGVKETARNPALIRMEDVPLAALHLYPEQELESIELSVEAGRGCPFACTFCSTANFFQRRYRIKSNKRLIDEMEMLRQRYGTRVFNLNHDLFGLKKSSLREFCQLIRGRNFEWKCSMRSDTLDVALLHQLVEAGCRDIYFGIESGSERLQSVIRKGLDIEQSKQTVECVSRFGVRCTVSFITGFPEEERCDQDESLDLIGWFWQLNPHLIRAQLHMLSPEPGSQLCESGEHSVHFDGIGPEADDLVDPSLIEAHPEIFSVFYHYRSATPRWRTVLASMFVNQVAPQLGIPFTSYLCSRFYQDRLSRLIDAIASDEPAMPLCSNAEIVGYLWARMSEVIDGLAADTPFVADLFRVSQMIVAIREFERENNDPTGAAWLIKLDYTLNRFIPLMLNGAGPAAQKSLQEPRYEPNWLLVRLEQGGIEAVPVRTALAEKFVETADRDIGSGGADGHRQKITEKLAHDRFLRLSL